MITHEFSCKTIMQAARQFIHARGNKTKTIRIDSGWLILEFKREF